MFHKALLVLPLLSLASPAFATPLETREASPGLIDGLLTGTLDAIRQSIKDILTGVKSGVADGDISSKPLICLSAVDKCCVWWDVSAELTKRFKETNGECNDAARAAIRFGFHDAGAWDKDTTTGGADGSLMMDFGEIDRPENNGLQSVRLLLREVQALFKVGYADLAQYAHNHATISCPKGPRIRTWVGRKDATGPAPTGKLPDVHDSPDNLIALFERKGFSAHDLAALVGAHAAAKQRFVDTSQAGKPLDTTPGVWDVEFYNDTLQEPQNPDIFVLPSDKKLSVHPKINDEWLSFVGDQPHWNEDYAKAYIRMSLLGVTSAELKGLKDCTKTLPKKTTK
ncbi:heme peroxidase [Paraphaeosphaeria sporulosa]|uniref:Peroxidase n=1 Tax=Paraphaeosphaeria sporulosa TaxID=1460663 RepID=A0A177CUH6_9PLEO|nr:heme peroxidase [Paraphaeosphaeria sporulosa]OAG11194.1 heme peroxidase [Paraphaeosphaeria sporulosa]